MCENDTSNKRNLSTDEKKKKEEIKKKRPFYVHDNSKNLNIRHQYKSKFNMVSVSDKSCRMGHIRRDNINLYPYQRNQEKVQTQKRDSQYSRRDKPIYRFDVKNKPFFKNGKDNTQKRSTNYERYTPRNNQTGVQVSQIRAPYFNFFPRSRGGKYEAMDRRSNPTFRQRFENDKFRNNYRENSKNNKYITKSSRSYNMKKYPHFFKRGKSKFIRDWYNFFNVKRPRFPRIIEHLCRSKKKRVGLFLRKPVLLTIKYPFRLNLNLVNEYLS